MQYESGQISVDLALLIATGVLLAALIKMSARYYSKKVDLLTQDLKKRGIEFAEKYGIWLTMLPIAGIILYDTFNDQSFGPFLAIIVYLISTLTPFTIPLTPSLIQLILTSIAILILGFFGHKILIAISNTGLAILKHPVLPPRIHALPRYVFNRRHLRKKQAEENRMLDREFERGVLEEVLGEDWKISSSSNPLYKKPIQYLLSHTKNFKRR